MNRFSIRKEILKHQFLIPFGRFKLDRNRVSRVASILIGREGQRAYLLDALSGVGTRGAFLVTGHRGIGKTTFVESCLQEYRENVFRRFLSSGTGRSLPDLLLLVTMLGIAITVAIGLSVLLQLMLDGAPGVLGNAQETQGNPFLWVPITLVSLILALPLLGSYLVLRTLFDLYNEAIAALLSLITQPLFIVPVGAGLFFFLGVTVFTDASLMLVLLSALGCVVLSAGLFSIRKKSFYAERLEARLKIRAQRSAATGPPCPESRNPAQEERRRSCAEARRIIVLLGGLVVERVLVPLALCAFLWGLIHWAPMAADANSPPPPWRDPLKVAAVSVGLILSVYSRSFWNRVWIAQQDRDQGTILQRVLRVLEALGIFALPSAFLLVGIGAVAILADDSWRAIGIFLGWGLGAFAIGGVVFLFLHWRLQRAPREGHDISADPPLVFVSPFESLLLLKALALTLVSAQLLGPLLAMVTSPEFPIPRSEDQITLVQRSAPIFLFFACMFILEYEWISRPFIRQREARALDRGARRNHAAHHHFDPIWLESWVEAQTSRWEEDRRKVEAERVEFLDRGAINHPIEWPTFLQTEQERADSLRVVRGRYKRFAEKIASLDSKIARLKTEAAKQKDDLAKRATWRFRALQAATTPFQVARIWLPILIVRVNLGFDDLDHRGVTYAMLYGLRREYERTFLSPFNPVWTCRGLMPLL